jgi:hypothetical protein
MRNCHTYTNPYRFSISDASFFDQPICWDRSCRLPQCNAYTFTYRYAYSASDKYSDTFPFR